MAKLTKDSRSGVRLQFFDLIFEDSEGVLCLATTAQAAPRATFKQTFWDWPNDATAIENWILKQEGKLNVYFCVNLLSRQERKKEACLPTDILWADLDEVD